MFVHRMYKDLIAKCNTLGRDEARARKKLEKAKEKLEKLKAIPFQKYPFHFPIILNN